MRKLFLLSAVILAVFVMTCGISVHESHGDAGADHKDMSGFVTHDQFEAGLEAWLPCNTIVMWSGSGLSR